MSDLVERLRETADMNIDWPPQPSLIRRAADEISLLRSLLDIEHRKNAAVDNCVIVNRRELEFQLLAERLQARVTDLESDLAAVTRIGRNSHHE